MEKIVNFKTAKLAKKKGFDWYSRLGNKTSLYNKKGEHVPYSNYGFMHSGLSDGYISAPTQSLLQKWLRDVHKHHVSVQTMFNHEIYGKPDKWKIDITNLKTAGFREWKDIDGKNSYEDFDSYEEALEFGLQELLNLI